MTGSYIQAPEDGAGKKIQSFENTIGENDVHSQASTLVNSSGEEVSLVQKATTPVIYNVTMTNADIEYSQALPASTRKYIIHTRDGTAFRLAFVTGKVASPTEPYWTVPADSDYYEDFIEPSSCTLYFGCASSGKVIEIICWS